MLKFKKITKNIIFSGCMISSLIFVNTVSANDYTVQIGAYKYLSQRTINSAERFGQIFKSKTNTNLTRIQIGSFANRYEAASLLKQLRSAGYSDAYITLLNTDITSNSTDNYALRSGDSSQYVSDVNNLDITTTNAPIVEATFDNLTEDEKSKATYLDGDLRIFENGQFMTVAQYRSSR